MLFSKKNLILCLAAVAFSGALVAEEFEKQIEGRQAYMGVLGYNMGMLGGMASGKMDYDADLASAAANNLALAAKMNNSTMWPQGSDMDNAEDTRAKAALWANFPEVVEHLDDLKTASASLASTAGNGLSALQKGLKPVGQTCKGCHDDFRAKDD